MHSIIITSACKYEAIGIKKSLFKFTTDIVKNPHCWIYRKSNHIIHHLITGVGTERSQSALIDLFGRVKPNLILNLGTAGSLQDSLRAGCLFLPEEIVDPAYNELLTDSHYQRCIREIAQRPGFDWQSGRLFTSFTSIGSPRVRAGIRAHYKCTAVDMEAYPQAKIARDNNVPFLCLKVISDQAGPFSLLSYFYNLRKVNALLYKICDAFLKTLNNE